MLCTSLFNSCCCCCGCVCRLQPWLLSTKLLLYLLGSSQAVSAGEWRVRWVPSVQVLSTSVCGERGGDLWILIAVEGKSVDGTVSGSCKPWWMQPWGKPRGCQCRHCCWLTAVWQEKALFCLSLASSGLRSGGLCLSSSLILSPCWPAGLRKGDLEVGAKYLCY